MDPDFEEPLFSLDIVKEEILESEEGQMWLVAGRDEGWPVKEEVVDAPMVKEEVEDGETWGNGGCAKSGNPNFGENPESKRMKWTPRTEASAYVTPKEMTAEVKKESEPFPAVGGQAVPLGSTYDSLPYAKLESFNAHVLLSTEYANAVKKEEEEKERQNSAEDRKNCPVDGCLENFLSHADLVDHMKKHPSPVICGLCKKSFPSPSNLRRHYVIHTREEKFACSCCGKRFIRLGDLRRHIQIHTGERPYECDVCEYKAAHPSNLRSIS